MQSIFLVHGEDDFLAREKLNYLKNGFIKKYGDLNVSTYNEENGSLDVIVNDILSAPFLSEKRMIILEGVISSWKKDPRAKLIEKLGLIPETNILLIFEERDLEDKETKLLELPDLKKKIDPKNIFIFKKAFGNDVASFVQKLCREGGYSMDPRAVNTLVGLVGPKTREINQEMKKLFSYKYEDKTITHEDVSKLVKSQISNSVFDLTDTLSKKDFKRAKTVLSNLTESGENPISILAMITTHFRNLVYLKIAEAESIPKEKVLSETKMHPFVYQKTSNQIRGFTLEKLKEIYQDIGNADIAIKTGEQEGELALDLLIGKICL